MRKIDFYDRWVLVTGASSGLGREIALVLAQKEKANVLLAARRRERLETLKKDIEKQQSVRAEIIQVDLSQPGGAEELFREATHTAPVYALVNNAGVTFYGKTEKKHIPLYEKIIQVNVMAPMRLNLLFMDYFMGRGEGAILNVTSHGAFIPMPYQNVYAASKSASQFFGEAFREENRRSGITVSQYAPGGFYSEMFTGSGLDKQMPRNRFFMMDARTAAIRAVRAFKKRKALIIPGMVYKVIHFLIRLFPRKWVVFVAGKIYRPKELDSRF